MGVRGGSSAVEVLRTRVVVEPWESPGTVTPVGSGGAPRPRPTRTRPRPGVPASRRPAGRPMAGRTNATALPAPDAIVAEAPAGEPACRTPRPVPAAVRPAPDSAAIRFVRAAAPGMVRLRSGVAFAAAMLAALIAVLALGLLASAARAASVPERTIPVQVAPGESLWQIAHRTAPNADVDAVVERIVARNGLRSATVEPGRVLSVPAGPGR